MLTATASQIITEALEQLGVLGEGETPTSNQISSSLTTLNMLTKTWQADGLHLFAVKDVYLFTKLGQKIYTFTDLTQDKFVSSYTNTTLYSAAASGDTTVNIVSAAGIFNGAEIGFLNGNSIIWKNVFSSTPGPGYTTVNLGSPVGTNLSAGTPTYLLGTGAPQKPLKLLEAYIIDPNGNTNLILNTVSRIDYDTLSTITTVGRPNQLYFNPQISYAELSLWPFPQNEGQVISMVVQRDLDSNTDTSELVDYPSEWFLPLAMNLAKLLAPKYGIPQMDYQRIALHAKELYEMARGFDQEMDVSVFFNPYNQGQRG